MYNDIHTIHGKSLLCNALNAPHLTRLMFYNTARGKDRNCFRTRSRAVVSATSLPCSCAKAPMIAKRDCAMIISYPDDKRFEGCSTVRKFRNRETEFLHLLAPILQHLVIHTIPRLLSSVSDAAENLFLYPLGFQFLSGLHAQMAFFPRDPVDPSNTLPDRFVTSRETPARREYAFLRLIRKLSSMLGAFFRTEKSQPIIIASSSEVKAFMSDGQPLRFFRKTNVFRGKNSSIDLIKLARVAVHFQLFLPSSSLRSHWNGGFHRWGRF